MEKGVWKEKGGGCYGRRKDGALRLVMLVFFVFLFFYCLLLFFRRTGLVFLGGEWL